MNQFIPLITLAAQPPRMAVVCSQWHSEVVRHGHEAFLTELERRGVTADQVERFEVPGVFEAPLLAKRLALSRRYAAVAVFGLLADGGMYRHDFMAQSVVDGLMRVQLDTGVPVISCVLSPHQFHEHEEHRRFYAEHFVVKGKETAYAALRTLENMRDLASRIDG